MTGHCPSKYYLNKIGKLESSECRFCQFGNETAEHILCSCAALFNQRRLIFGKGLLEPIDVWQNNPSRVLDFIR